MMGGDIAVTSEAGRGSTFTVRLPAEVDARAASVVEGLAQDSTSPGSSGRETP
jgi:chemotaxis protein histidine kinase CheA